ncbi:hypothetical protein RCC89_07280 [Cytophagaceae bacterium ABcell3]|nr:hypothetical protein RCC89_07280 [Cytophagaceae bacterium ABcell3]
MRRIKFKGYLIFLSGLFLLGSCCTKMECVSGIDTQVVNLISFNSQEVDTIYVASCLRGAGFRTLVDSAFASASYTFGDALVINMPIELNKACDYRFVFSHSGKKYDITNITTGMRTCNKCFLTSDEFEALNSYEVNGEIVHSGAFEIIDRYQLEL